MRQVNIRTLKAQLSFELKNLPFQITKNGKIIAECSHNDSGKAENSDIRNFPKKISIENNNKKSFLPMGVRHEVFFNPQPKGGTK